MSFWQPFLKPHQTYLIWLLLAGTDATPSDLLDGAAQISGTSVYQRVKAGVSGCTYKLRCTATNSGAGNETYVLTASLGVVTA